MGGRYFKRRLRVYYKLIESKTNLTRALLVHSRRQRHFKDGFNQKKKQALKKTRDSEVIFLNDPKVHA